jgi:hypothetical protein
MSKIWTIRGVSDDMQRRAAEAANAAGMRLGPWVERALRAGLERSASDGDSHVPGDLVAQFAALVERVERLEAGAGTTVPGHPSPNAAAPVGRARKPAVASKARTARKPVAVSDSGDIEGGKKDNRLPDYVYDKVRDLIEKHPEMKNPAIGKAVGISKETVRRIRNGIR